MCMPHMHPSHLLGGMDIGGAASFLVWRPSWLVTSSSCESFSWVRHLILWGTNQVQTNLSVQTMKTPIWIIGSISKGYEGLDKFTIWIRPWIIGQSHFCKSLLPPLYTRPLGCWSDDPDWSFHILYGEVGLHLICSRFYTRTDSYILRFIITFHAS